MALADGDYEVRIDSTLQDGHLTYGECYLPGRSSDEVLISCHVCHPSLANDNLSGVTIATSRPTISRKGPSLFLSLPVDTRNHRGHYLAGQESRDGWTYTPRPGLDLPGDACGFHYKKSRRGDAEIDRAPLTFYANRANLRGIGISPYGYDERQYCSPGFNLPVGCLMRSVWGSFPEYHTSADNLDFIPPLALAGSLRVCAAIVNVLENNRSYRNLSPYCEPQLGRATSIDLRAEM